MTAPLCLSLFQLCQGQYDAVWRKLSAQRATADTAAELGCGISPHVSFRSARLQIGAMLRSYAAGTMLSHGAQVGSLAAPLTVLVPPKRIRVDQINLPASQVPPLGR